MFTKLTSTFTLAAILALAHVLAACSSLTESEKPAINIWWLQPVTTMPVADDAPVSVLLDVDAVAGLDDDKVLALSSDAQLIPYAGALWADDLPDLVASLITRSLQASGHFEVLQRGRAGAAASACELQLELTEFFADLEAGGRTRGVSVGVGGKYSCGTSGPHGLASRAYVDVDAERMSVIVAAFQKALDQVTLDIIRQLDIKQ